MRFAILLISLLAGGVIAMNATSDGVPFLLAAVIYAIFSIAAALLAALTGVPHRRQVYNPFVRLDDASDPPNWLAGPGQGVTSPLTPSQAPGTRSRPRTRSGLVGGGISTPGRAVNPNFP